MPRTSRLRRRRRPSLRIEHLEPRNLLSGLGAPQLLNPTPEAEPNDTLDVAQDLGTATVSRAAEATGQVGNGAAGGADVDWYSFTLTQASAVQLVAFNNAGNTAFRPVLSLYQQTTDIYDPYAPYGYRLLSQQDAGANLNGLASVAQTLGPATYWVAISGSGNRFFNPRLPDSGDEGLRGNYGLSIQATELPTEPGSGPVIVASNVAAGASLRSSPFVLRLATSSPLDPNSLAPDVTLFLTYNPTGAFGDGNDLPIFFQATFSAMANELQLLPLSPFTYGPQLLAPGHYQLRLAGDLNTTGSAILDLNGIPFGADSSNPTGHDFVLTFEIAGAEGRSNGPADDIAAGAYELGNVTRAGLVQRQGAIGDDPAYDPANPDPTLANPASDVDLYHFRITGAGRYSVAIEIGAGRIGSSLDSAVSLYRVDSSDGQLRLVAFNDSTFNASQASDGSTPLYFDAVLFAGLLAGEYYAAVSGAGNMPDPSMGLDVGTNGVFDPNVSHSGMNGYSTGNYVLSVAVRPDNQGPRLTGINLVRGSSPDASPTQFTVRFDESVNLPALANQAMLISTVGGIEGVFIRGADGIDYYPRLLSYDSSTNEAVFLMLDRLPNGINDLHLSGALGLADLAGNPLVSNDPWYPASDFVVSFSVNGIVAGSPGNPRLWLNEQGHDTLAQAQDLGVLFPRELQNGVTLRRTLDPSASDMGDYYRFEILQSRSYFFALYNHAGLPAGTVPRLFTADGRSIYTTGATVRQVNLDPGTYYVRVTGWTGANAPNVKYDLRITLGTSTENPTPLTAGPGPAYRLNFRLTDTTSNGGGTTNPGPTLVTNTTTTTTTTTNTPRLNLSDANTGLGVVPAFLATTGQSLALGAGYQMGLSELSEGPIGAVRANSPNDGAPKRTRLVLPGSSGKAADNDPIRLAIAEEDEFAEGGARMPSRPATDELFATFARMLERLRSNLSATVPDRRDVMKWFAQWLGEVTGTAIRPSSIEESEPLDPRSWDEENEACLSVEEAETLSDGNFVWAAGFFVAGCLALAKEDEKRAWKKCGSA